MNFPQGTSSLLLDPATVSLHNALYSTRKHRFEELDLVLLLFHFDLKSRTQLWLMCPSASISLLDLIERLNGFFLSAPASSHYHVLSKIAVHKWYSTIEKDVVPQYLEHTERYRLCWPLQAELLIRQSTDPGFLCQVNQVVLDDVQAPKVLSRNCTFS